MKARPKKAEKSSKYSWTWKEIFVLGLAAGIIFTFTDSLVTCAVHYFRGEEEPTTEKCPNCGGIFNIGSLMPLETQLRHRNEYFETRDGDPYVVYG